MIHDLDEALRRLLIREIPIKNSEVEIKFEQPSREWSARLSRPTLNLFLFDVRENAKLRQARPTWQMERHDDGSITRRIKAVRVDLHYMVTAWANDPDDEHRLLAGTLLALFRNPELPEELLPESLQNQPAPITIMVAQEDELKNPTDVWNVLDNEMRPAVNCVVTIALDPYRPIVGPMVRTRELRFGQAGRPWFEKLDQPAAAHVCWTIGGMVHSKQPLDELRLTLVERGQEVPLQPEGRFAIGNLQAGEYTLEVTADGQEPRRYNISVPAPDYDIEM